MAHTSYFEKWLISLSPAMPNHIGKVLGALRQINGKHICEIGCGQGTLTHELARRGARISASDISIEAVQEARETNREFIPMQVDVQCMDACNLLYAHESFDFVVGMAILHHLDSVKVAKEVSRVLKPNGKAVFIEPLSYNPLSNLWRRLSPSIRVPSEHPLVYSDISEMSKYFRATAYSEYALLTLLSSFVYLITCSHTAKQKAADFLERLEPTVLKACKPLRKYSGAILIDFVK